MPGRLRRPVFLWGQYNRRGNALAWWTTNFHDFFHAIVHVPRDLLPQHAPGHFVAAPELDRHWPRFVALFPSEKLRLERLTASFSCFVPYGIGAERWQRELLGFHSIGEWK